MKVGIIGLPQVGKKTLFELLTGGAVSVDAASTKHVVHSVVSIKDPRFDRLVSIYSPKKEVPASIEFTLFFKFDKEVIKGAEFLRFLHETEALCHIVRAFREESVFHIDGSVDPKRDIENVNTELLLTDLMLIEKRLERMDKEKEKLHDTSFKNERELVAKLKVHLEGGLPLRTYPLTASDAKVLSAYQFLTIKPMIIVLNVGEDELNGDGLVSRLKDTFKDQGLRFVQLSAKIEDELSKFTDEEEKEDFMRELGVSEPAIDKMRRLCFEALGLITFFTVKHDELHAWPLRRGSTVLQAAGTIHSDMERGFIRAEVIKYTDMESLGSEAKVKEAGKLLLKGKDYIVEDGDIISIRFNV